MYVEDAEEPIPNINIAWNHNEKGEQEKSNKAFTRYQFLVLHWFYNGDETADRGEEQSSQLRGTSYTTYVINEKKTRVHEEAISS